MARTHLLALLALTSVPSAQRLIAVDSGGALYDLDMTTGAKTQFGTVSANAGTVGGLAYDPDTKTIYLSSTTNDSLYRLALASGTATLVGPYGDPAVVMHGLEWRMYNDTLWGVSSHNNGLYRINPSTGAATLIGTSGLSSFTNLGLGLGDTVVLYATNSGTDSLYTVDTSTGTATLVGALSGPTNPNGLAFDSDTERMFMVDNTVDALYTINLATGAATLVGSTGPGNLLGLVYIPREFTIRSKCTETVSCRVHRLPPSSDRPWWALSDFRALGASAADQLYQTLWAYRIDGDTREYIFNSSPSSGLGPVLLPQPDTAVLSWTNCDGRGFDAKLTYSVYSTLTGGVLSQRLTMTNRTATTMRVNVYAYADIEAGGTRYDDRATFVGSVGQMQEITNLAAERCYFLGCGNDAYETTSFGALILKLTNTSIDNLNNTGVPFGPGDWSSAYQWRDVRIAAGGSRTFDVAITQRFPVPCCAPAAFETYCVGKRGTHGVPAWGPALMRVCSETELKITNGYQGSAPFVLVGAAPGACVVVPPYGSLAVLPILTSFFMPAFDLARESRACLLVPCNPGLCGLELTMQAWFADPGAPGSVVHTDGAKFTIGSL